MVLGLLSEILVIDLPKYDIRSAHKSLIQLLQLLFKTTEKSLLCFSVAQGAHVSHPPPPSRPVLQPPPTPLLSTHSTVLLYSHLAIKCSNLFPTVMQGSSDEREAFHLESRMMACVLQQ